MRLPRITGNHCYFHLELTVSSVGGIQWQNVCCLGARHEYWQLHPCVRFGSWFERQLKITDSLSVSFQLRYVQVLVRVDRLTFRGSGTRFRPTLQSPCLRWIRRKRKVATCPHHSTTPTASLHARTPTNALCQFTCADTNKCAVSVYMRGHQQMRCVSLHARTPTNALCQFTCTNTNKCAVSVYMHEHQQMRCQLYVTKTSLHVPVCVYPLRGMCGYSFRFEPD
jgi:hypothetical protein